jgi:hypothetical protein
MYRSDPAYLKSSAFQDVRYASCGPTSRPAVAAPHHGSEERKEEIDAESSRGRKRWRRRQTSMDPAPPSSGTSVAPSPSATAAGSPPVAAWTPTPLLICLCPSPGCIERGGGARPESLLLFRLARGAAPHGWGGRRRAGRVCPRLRTPPSGPRRRAPPPGPLDPNAGGVISMDPRRGRMGADAVAGAEGVRWAEGARQRRE